jgi:hypothetical protein
MTWTERVGDVATTTALLLVNLGRIVTLFVRVATSALDRFVTNLAERGESGIAKSGTSGPSWVGLPAAVAWGAAAIVLRALSVVTVLARQVAETADDFLRTLTDDGPAPGPAPSPASPLPAAPRGGPGAAPAPGYGLAAGAAQPAA